MKRTREKAKRAKNNGGGYPAQQPPGMPRGIHVRGRSAEDPCRCGGCSGAK